MAVWKSNRTLKKYNKKQNCNFQSYTVLVTINMALRIAFCGKEDKYAGKRKISDDSGQNKRLCICRGVG